MSARMAGAFAHTFLSDRHKYLTRRTRVVFCVLTAVTLLCRLALIALYPVLWTATPVWLTFAAVLSIALRSVAGRRLIGRRMRRTIGARAYWLLTALVHLVPLAAMAWILSANLDAATAWQLWGGFAAGGVLELYSQWRERDLLALEDLPDDTDPQTAAQMAADLREVNAFDAFQRMHTLVLIALQLTLVMVYTFIGLSTQELLVCMLLAVACTVIMREVSLLCLRLVKRPFDTQLLLVGLFLWLYGLILLYRQLDSRPELLMSALAVALCTSGLAVSVTALAELERRMTDVAQFRLKDRMRGYAQLRASSTEIAILLGQMLALILLTLLCMPSVPLAPAGSALAHFRLPAADGDPAGAATAGSDHLHAALSHEQPSFSEAGALAHPGERRPGQSGPSPAAGQRGGQAPQEPLRGADHHHAPAPAVLPSGDRQGKPQWL